MEIISLTGAWQLQQEGDATVIPAQVPGCVHTDLLQTGLIDDPFYRRQELDVQWVGERNWVYTREFTVPAEMLTRQRVLLHCDGLDTFAQVLLNDTLLGVCDNMFRTWEFDVTPVLRDGVNRLTVQFDSPLPYMAQQQAIHPLATTQNAPHEHAGRSYVRKMPCGFGWDWGPALVTCGIWRSLELRAFDVARLRDVSIQQDHSQAGVVELSVVVVVEDLVPPSTCTAAVTLSLQGSMVAETCCPIGADGASAQLTITNPQLWWPRGMGEQPLYQVQVRLLDADGIERDQWVRRIGLRSLRLDRHPDEWGESFQFVANGIPFFAKGGNWIPADAFVTRVTPDTYRALLQSCADANMNMLRVWGGGIYEDDFFYDLCDELGICVWQEFIFACASYPAWDPAFLANVRGEAEDNVRRLRHHASLALWCGNNELEMCGYVREDADSQDRMGWTDYRTLFDTLLPDVVTRLDPEHDYWPSSSHT
ncbi:MAG TPA: hypothetical protein VGL77_19110, partial [Armatimonadota bacterium]